MTWLLAGCVFGFLGSLHCVGMCGPLALSLPGRDASRLRFLLERLLYNLGRAMTYTALGGMVGAAGRLVSLAGAQQVLSVGVGVLFLLVAAVPWVSRRVQRVEQAPSAFLQRIMAPIGTLYRRGGTGSLFVVGLLNGLLPCGFVYAGLATALTAGTAAASMLFMAGFGLGTFPALLGVSLVGRVAGAAWRTRLQKLVPLGLAVVGLLLILRGLGWGGMISPALSSPSG
ncbi:MAG: sulfite exporter TauE/SafE family protein [Salinivenus sp.]